MQQLSDLDYDAIENAVMETARGRWFLSEYKKRNSGASTSTLLDAISRLEKVVTTLNDGSYTSKSAETSNKAPKLVEVETASPKEPKAKKLFAAPTPFFSGGKKQETETAKTETVSVPEPAALNDENLKFFSNDEDLFSNDANDLLPDVSPIQAAPVKEVKIVKAPEVKAQEPETAATKLDEETVNLSDRFKVFRTEPNDFPETTPEQDAIEPSDEKVEAAAEPSLDQLFGGMPEQDQPAAAPELEAAPVEEKAETVVEAPASPVVPDPVMDATKEEKDRIVIIRGNSDSSLDIPFGDDIFGEKENKPTLS